jgi:hypothetical protein
VVSSSTPNITAEVREAVGKLILANPAPRMPASPAGANGAAPQGSGNAGLPASGAGAIDEWRCRAGRCDAGARTGHAGEGPVAHPASEIATPSPRA